MVYGAGRIGLSSWWVRAIVSRGGGVEHGNGPRFRIDKAGSSQVSAKIDRGR